MQSDGRGSRGPPAVGAGHHLFCAARLPPAGGEPPQSVALKDDPVLFSRPSIDVLFETAAEVFGAGLIAVVLSGANDDGARGAAVIQACGGTVLVQDPKQALVPVMPEAALRSCPAAKILSLDAIAQYLREV